MKQSHLLEFASRTRPVQIFPLFSETYVSIILHVRANVTEVIQPESQCFGNRCSNTKFYKIYLWNIQYNSFIWLVRIMSVFYQKQNHSGNFAYISYSGRLYSRDDNSPHFAFPGKRRTKPIKRCKFYCSPRFDIFFGIHTDGKKASEKGSDSINLDSNIKFSIWTCRTILFQSNDTLIYYDRIYRRFFRI